MAYGTVNVGQGKTEDIPVYMANLVEDYNGYAWVKVNDVDAQNLPKKFSLRLINNDFIKPVRKADGKYTSYYNTEILFLACSNGGNPMTEEADYAQAIKIYNYNGSLTTAQAHNMAGINGTKYDFEWDESVNAYILLNPHNLARNTSLTTAAGYGLSRVLNKLDRDSFVQGEALSAYQGYRLGMQNESAIPMTLINSEISQYWIPSNDPGLTSTSPYDGMLITVIPDTTNEFIIPTLKISSSQDDGTVAHPIGIKDINGNLVQPPAGILKANQAVALMYSNNIWNILNMTSPYVEGVWKPTRTDSSSTSTVYSVTLNPAPTSLYTGMKITIIPSVTSSSTEPTLNVNGLGAKRIYVAGMLGFNADPLPSTNCLQNDKPATLLYNGTGWLLTSIQTVHWDDINEKPTGLVQASTTTAFQARVYNGTYQPPVGTSAFRNVYAGTTAMTSGTTALTTGTIYLQYEE